MKNPKSYFRFISNVTIAINLVVGISAIFLVERIIPAIDDILQENAYSVQASIALQSSILLSDEEKFWTTLEKAKSNITLEGEQEIVDEIRVLGKSYWQEAQSAKEALIAKIEDLSTVNLRAMDEKEKEASFLGTAGAWSLAFLVVSCTALQLIARRKVITLFIEPILELITVLTTYYQGNRLRRFSNPDATDAIKDAGLILNKILDRDLSNQQ
jgi:sulfatase maturation enzyme AslB (radical SAM superfamily)